MTTATISLSALRTAARPAVPAAPRWRVEEIEALYALPFADLLWRAQAVHREHFHG